MQFYRFLQTCRCCLVATSPGPVARVFPPASPFRSSFGRIEQLQELSFEDAIQLIAKIAEYRRDRELLALIQTPRGRARVRALRQLAGGNHRAWVILAPLLTRESIGKLIRPLMETIDDLTPYYNSRIAALPWEQRQILEYVREVRQAVRTGERTILEALVGVDAEAIAWVEDCLSAFLHKQHQVRAAFPPQHAVAVGKVERAAAELILFRKQRLLRRIPQGAKRLGTRVRAEEMLFPPVW